jgi:ABC-type nitrate/sulfonate/bicarbonate transport system substrate-binding protein
MNGMRIAATILCLLASAGPAAAETVRIARQFGISYLPLILMQDGKLLEQEGKARGLELMPEWVTPFNLVWTTTRYYGANPKVVEAFMAALDRAMTEIRADPLEAAAVWVRVEKARLTPEQAAEMVRRPENDWTTTPKNIMRFARFMQETGALQVRPDEWRDVFFPTMQRADGG